MKEYTIDDFYKANESKLDSKGVVFTPPLYYQSLNDAFNNYFTTLRKIKDTYHFLLDLNSWNKGESTWDFQNADNAVFTILGFHRFFELLLKDILKRIDPKLAVKFPERENETIKFYNNELGTEQMETVEFRKAFERFKEAIKYQKQHPDKKEYEIVRKFSFLNSTSLITLSRWRNRIMHNGNTIPNVFLLDFLVSQQIIPIVQEVIRVDKEVLKDYKPHFFETVTGIKIIEEIIKIKIDFTEFTDISKGHQLALKFLRLAHLKELGRAMFSVDLATVKLNIPYYAPYYTDPIGRNMRFAELEKTNSSFYALKKCSCCGIESLVVYRKEFDDFFSTNKLFISWFHCFTCTYSLKDNLGDPNDFGYSNEKIFGQN